MKEKKPPHTTRSALKQQALEGWENEGGEIPTVPTPRTAEISAHTGPRTRVNPNTKLKPS